jgi:hypothetical protein
MFGKIGQKTSPLLISNRATMPQTPSTLCFRLGISVRIIMKKTLLLVLLFAFSAAVMAQSELNPRTEDAIKLLRHGKADEAIEIFKEVVEKNKKDYRAWRYLGLAYLYKGNRREANRALRNALRGPRFGDRRTEPGPDYYAPPELLSMSSPDVQMAQRNSAGSVILLVELKSDGTVGFIHPVQEMPAGLTEASIAAAQRISFRPAREHGENVAVFVLVEYSFRL